jgi:hypothetical protein
MNSILYKKELDCVVSPSQRAPPLNSAAPTVWRLRRAITVYGRLGSISVQ